MTNKIYSAKPVYMAPQQVKHILLVGCGNIGRAMLSQWLRNPQLNFILLEREPSIALFDLIEPHANRILINPTVPFKADVAVLAVKPQQMEEALIPLTHGLPLETLIISIAGGKKISYYEQHFKPSQPIIRAMPNMAASVAESITVCVANKNITSKHRTLVDFLFEAIGKVVWCENEESLSSVTAISGSGPAYIFLLTECLVEAAKAGGLDAKMAAELARQTVIGAGAQLKQSKFSAEDLRKQVTSPGGTTEAALKILMSENGLKQLIANAVKVATERAKQMAN
jgi:pyrroline-5-carboxylate reductase